MSRILVVDDDPDIVELVKLRLELAGHAVRTASDGELAWEAILDEVPDLLVLDVSMPRLDGLALTRRLREHAETHDLAILVLTAAVQTAVAEDVIAAGATAYAKKPFSPKALVARVQELLDQAAAT